MLTLLLDFMYTRKVHLTSANLNNVLRIADVYLVAGLFELCCKYKLDTIDLENCIDTWLFADRIYRPDIVLAARRQVLLNLHLLKDHRDFGKLEFSQILGLLSDSRLNVKREEHAWEAAVRWIEHVPEERSKHIAEFLRFIRIGLMDIKYFEERVQMHPYVMKHMPECSDFLRLSYDFLQQMEAINDASMLNLRHPFIIPRIPNDVLFTVGGWSAGCPITYFESYDTRADRWYRLKDMEGPSPRAYHGLVSIGFQIYCMGGYDGSQYYNRYN